MVGFRTGPIILLPPLYAPVRHCRLHIVNVQAGRRSARSPFLLSTIPLLLATALGTTGPVTGPTTGPAGRHSPTAFFCTDPQRTSTIQGHPDVTSVPSLESVSLLPSAGGLAVSFEFHRPLVFAPEGVYISWTVFVYRHRGDASNYEGGVQLEFQDRGKGWEPAGWAIVASTYTRQSPLQGEVRIRRGAQRAYCVFPVGFCQLGPTFLLVCQPGGIQGLPAQGRQRCASRLEHKRGYLHGLSRRGPS